MIERAPTAAFVLHWFTSVLLIAVTAPIKDPRKSYSILVYLFTYSIVLVLGGWVALALVRVKFAKERWHWQECRRYRPWLSPIHVMFYLLATSFLAIAAFIPPGQDSPFYHSVTGVPWYVLPLIGVSAPFWGILWFAGLRIYERVTYTQLEIVRRPIYVPDTKYPSEYIQRAELVTHWWPVQDSSEGSDDFSKGHIIHNQNAHQSASGIELEDAQGGRIGHDDFRDPGQGRRSSDSFTN